ncbi:gp019 (endogenous virus) [Lactococcus phage KSY1]|uniref:Gp019 n=1 Tax=Lactococcus phage KSY1 TaxID=2913972 RepID=A6MA83_9CAUD|nr:gp019 [Lactococcus phage KSY1]ABG21561.1 gp019 [Lactococcus phage KSY1]
MTKTTSVHLRHNAWIHSLWEKSHKIHWVSTIRRK